MTVLVAMLALGTASAQDNQYFPFFQQEYFFGNAPSARHEALARAGATLGGQTAGVFYNPATLGLVDRGQANFSTSAPFYLLENADYAFLGLAYRVVDRWVVGLSANNLAVGPSSFSINIGPERYPVDSPVVTNVALTNTVEIVDGLVLGANLNGFRWKFLDDAPVATAFHVDLGALYRIGLPDLPKATHTLTLGTGFNNVTVTRIRFESPDGLESSNVFPVVFRGGASYEAVIPVTLPGAGEGPLRVLGLFEVQDLLNNGFRTAVRLATEVAAYDVIALRLGAYTINQDDMGVATNRSRVADLTYGFGVQVPIDSITEGKVPLRASVDFATLRPPPLTDPPGARRSNLRTFTLGLSWTQGGEP